MSPLSPWQWTAGVCCTYALGKIHRSSTASSRWVGMIQRWGAALAS